MIDRALRIMQALLQAFAVRRWSVKAPPAAKKASLWGGSPAYAFTPSGLLRLRIGAEAVASWQWEVAEDAPSTLQSRLGEFCIALVRAAEYMKAWHVRREASRREWQAKEQREAELRLAAQREGDRVKVLREYVEDWELAVSIRRFADAIEARACNLESPHTANPDKLAEWVRWARERADLLDPLTDLGQLRWIP